MKVWASFFFFKHKQKMKLILRKHCTCEFHKVLKVWWKDLIMKQEFVNERVSSLVVRPWAGDILRVYDDFGPSEKTPEPRRWWWLRPDHSKVRNQEENGAETGRGWPSEMSGIRMHKTLLRQETGLSNLAESVTEKYLFAPLSFERYHMIQR